MIIEYTSGVSQVGIRVNTASYRNWMLAACCVALAVSAACWLAPRAEAEARVGEYVVLPAVMNDDGLYSQSWFLESFLDIGDDLSDATREGKRFAIIWEQKGCSYCEKTHLINLVDPEIQKFLRAHFTILQLDIHGARKVTDFDGAEMEERELARKFSVAFTPTIQFFPDQIDAAAGLSGRQAEIVRMPGYFPPEAFLAMFRFIEDRAYETMIFPDYMRQLKQKAPVIE